MDELSDEQEQLNVLEAPLDQPPVRCWSAGFGEDLAGRLAG